MTNNGTVLIFTGMHRSGTSLIANVLSQAGINIGKKLIEADPRNPHGFFEDVGFYEFHQQALYNRGKTPYVKQALDFKPTLAEMEQAKTLIRQRGNSSLWGWKDPRTCLFLEFWHQLLPQARYLFVYRHPLEVLISFVRRREAHTVGLLEGIASWMVYNSEILEFYQQHPEICALCHTYSVIEQIADFKKLLKQRFDLVLPLDAVTVESIYHPAELKKAPLTAEIAAMLRRIHPEMIQLFEQLEILADLPSRSRPHVAQPTPELSSLSRFVEELPGPHSNGRIRGLLFLLLALLEPTLIDIFFEEHANYIIQLEHDRGRLESSLAWIERLEEDVRRKQDWIEKQDENIRNLEETLAGMQNSYTWRIGRRVADSPVGAMARYLLRLGQSKSQV
jgi:hypothetical protein